MLEELWLITLEIIVNAAKAYESAKADPTTAANALAKATAAKAALLTEAAGFAADDAEAEANLKLRLGQTP